MFQTEKESCRWRFSGAEKNEKCASKRLKRWSKKCNK